MTYPPRRGALQAADPVTQAVMLAVDQSGLDLDWVAKRSGINRNMILDWRRGRSSANAKSLSYILEAIGATVTVTDVNAKKAPPIRLASLNRIRAAVRSG